MKATLTKEGSIRIQAETEFESNYLENWDKTNGTKMVETCISLLRHDDSFLVNDN